MNQYTKYLTQMNTADLAAELKRRERAEAMRKHRDAFPIADEPMFGPTRETLREIHITERIAARRAERVAALADIERLPIWDLPTFEEIAVEDDEHNGSYRASDIADLVAIEFTATQYAQGMQSPTGSPSMKLTHAQALNASRMIGERDDQGEWQPTTHTETRRDGTPYKRYVTEQMHQISDVHQLEGGDRIIVAVEVDGAPFVIHAHKRWLNMSKASSVKLFGAIYPNRNIPRRGLRFFYEPVSYIRTVHTGEEATEADDLAWRWASEDRLTETDNAAHTEPDTVAPDYLRPQNRRPEGSNLTPKMAKAFDEAIARAPKD